MESVVNEMQPRRDARPIEEGHHNPQTTPDLKLQECSGESGSELSHHRDACMWFEFFLTLNSSSLLM